MTADPLMQRARRLWEELAATPVSFATHAGVSVVTSPHSLMCPPGWVGIVVLGESAIITAPSDASAAAIRAVVVDLPAHALIDIELISSLLPVGEVLGPASLAYLQANAFRRTPPKSRLVDQLPPQHPALHALESSAGDDDSGESGLDEITSPAFVIRNGDAVIAAAGYRNWPRHTAHLSVLTDPAWRGQGLARVAASAAVEHALAAGLLPQWRARPPESRQVALALGFEELGAQLSIRLTHD